MSLCIDAEPLPAQKPSRVVIEVKSRNDDAWITADGEQVSRYWKAGSEEVRALRR
jgi:hypothetical protein